MFILFSSERISPQSVALNRCFDSCAGCERNALATALSRPILTGRLLLHFAWFKATRLKANDHVMHPGLLLMTNENRFVGRIFLAISSIDGLLYTHADGKLRIVGGTDKNLTPKYRIVKDR